MEEFVSSNLVIILLLAVWSLYWKGLALWRSARNNQLPWFVALLLINTLGLLEILYVFALAKDKNPKTD